MGPLKSEIRSRPSGGTSLTDPESRPKVPKHFFKPMPAELRYAKFCFDAVCFLILTISHLCAVFPLSKNVIVIHKSIHSFDYFFSLCRFNPLMIHFISLFLCGVFFWWHFVNSVSRWMLCNGTNTHLHHHGQQRTTCRYKWCYRMADSVKEETCHLLYCHYKYCQLKNAQLQSLSNKHVGFGSSAPTWCHSGCQCPFLYFPTQQTWQHMIWKIYMIYMLGYDMIWYDLKQNKTIPNE